MLGGDNPTEQTLLFAEELMEGKKKNRDNFRNDQP
jgi:hypothetical protein